MRYCGQPYPRNQEMTGPEGKLSADAAPRRQDRYREVPEAGASEPPTTTVTGDDGMHERLHEELSHLEIRTLVLMRHAKSSHPEGVGDHDRPLTEPGRAAAGLAGYWLRAHLDPIDEIVSSTALRAQQTAVATGLVAPIRSDGDLYDAHPQDVLRVLRATDHRVRTLLVVGHAPGIPGAAAQLATGAVDWSQKWPWVKAVAVLQFPGDWTALEAGAARLTYFRIPPD